MRPILQLCSPLMHPPGKAAHANSLQAWSNELNQISCELIIHAWQMPSMQLQGHPHLGHNHLPWLALAPACTLPPYPVFLAPKQCRQGKGTNKNPRWLAWATTNCSSHRPHLPTAAVTICQKQQTAYCQVQRSPTASASSARHAAVVTNRHLASTRTGASTIPRQHTPVLPSPAPVCAGREA